MVRLWKPEKLRSAIRPPLGDKRLKVRRALVLFVVALFATSVIGLAFHSYKASAAYTCLNGGDHAGANWDPATDCPGGIAGNHTNIGTLTIGTGETATVQAYNGSQYGSVQISATTITITGTLTAAGGGYAGGASNAVGSGTGGGGYPYITCGRTGAGGGYGGAGGDGSAGGGAAGGVTYGAYNAPVSLGSGGGGGCGGPGAAGGGAIQLTASGTTTINGTVTAAGATAAVNCQPGGGGSGGSVYLTTGTLAGSGTITANGGGGTVNCGASGNGGGGRVYVAYSSSNTFSGSAPSANAGSGGSGGQPGTSLLVDTTNNDLYIQTSQTWNANPSHEGQNFTYRNVTVSNSVTWTIIGYYTTNSNGVGMAFNVASFTIGTGSSITADGQGYAGGGTSASGSGSGGGGAGGPSSCGQSGAGGGYGGVGGNGSLTALGGTTYGSYSAPTSLGSGGGGGCGGPGSSGGGAIKIAASGTVTINGSLSANGSVAALNCQPGGGGAGGSIYIKSGTLTGNGSISANGGGGVGNCSSSGNGSGGRIAIYYSVANTYSGTAPSVAAGSGGIGGSPGTNILVNSSTNDLYINSSQTWNASPSLEGSNFTYNSVTVAAGITWTLGGYYTTNSNGVGMAFKVYNFTVNSGSKINMDGQGYAGGAANGGAGAGPGGGGSGTSSGSGGGGGYGGSGGSWGPGAAGGSYGSSTDPVDLGSGGGGGAGSGGAGGAGGGAIKIVATGTVSVNGTISANGAVGSSCGGQGGAGGSGGSIFIIAGSLTGAGTLTSNGGSAGSCDSGGAGGRISVWYGYDLSWTGTALDAAHAAVLGAAGSNGTNGSVIVEHHALLDRSVTMSTSGPGATSVSYDVSIKPAANTTVGGIIVDACDDTPIFGSSSCAYPSGFSWGSGTPGLTINGGMGSGWTATGVQGGAGSGQSQVVELSNATPQSVSTSTPMDFTVTTATNPSTPNHPFYIRVITFNTSGNMSSEYTVTGTTRSGNLPDSLDHGGMALSTGQGVALQFSVPEALTFCVSKSAIGPSCSGVVAPAITLGHSVGTTTVLDASQIDSTSVYLQTSTNALYGVAVFIKNTNNAATCGGLTPNNGATCDIPAANTSCSGSCSAVTFTAGTAAMGLCVIPGTGNVTVAAPYNGASCGSGTAYGLDDATSNGVRSTYGSQLLSSAGSLNQENDTVVFAATASSSSRAGIYTGNYMLCATGAF